MANASLAVLIRRFLEGQSSLSVANEIEGALSANFPQDESAEDLAAMLAQYSPGGGDYLYSQRDMAEPLRRFLARLESSS